MTDIEKVIAEVARIREYYFGEMTSYEGDVLDTVLALLKKQVLKRPVCERCGKPIDHIITSVFNYDGSDSVYRMPLSYYPERGCVSFETSQNWTGYDLSDEERKEDICCPHCGKYPFSKDVGIEFNEPVEVLMWTSRPTDEQMEAVKQDD